MLTCCAENLRLLLPHISLYIKYITAIPKSQVQKRKNKQLRNAMGTEVGIYEKRNGYIV